MLTVNEVSKLTGVSIRTLQYYDRIGLLKPAYYTEAGYRMYDDTSLEMLQQILLYRELEFPLKEIRDIIHSSDFDRNRALEQQIELLTMKKEHLENLILFARGIHGIGVRNMDFSVFDTKKMDEYAAQAKANWGKTAEYKEFEEKQKKRSKGDDRALMVEFMDIFRRIGELRESDPSAAPVQALVKELQDYITEHFYTCSDAILNQLGMMYSGGGSMNENIDSVGGPGTGAFAAKAIGVYVNQK